MSSGGYMLQPCPLCKQNLEFFPELAGMVVECPYCKGQINCNFPASMMPVKPPPPIPALPYYPPQEYVVRSEPRRRGTELHPGIAALLSFFVPGAGQLYCGDVLGGMCVFILWVGFLVLAIPTIGITLICACILWVCGVFIAYIEAASPKRR